MIKFIKNLVADEYRTDGEDYPVVLAVSLDGDSSDITARWEHNGVTIVGDSLSLVIDSASKGDAGKYQVFVTDHNNNDAVLESNICTLRVGEAYRGGNVVGSHGCNAQRIASGRASGSITF
ncbi:hypothetical protein OPW07_24225 [Vibrio europaeus]|uniref:hypothetical protein n=1 Tax=Vibrio europaeus TaxID=300876 RepID=UPI0018A74AE2|nr:hypothetical protein [Vibrio europaeus]MDC5812831.1 hypothetical protein [Vibrio europaeus]QPG37625.1 hypothetical protein IXK98_15060 [Vibrio europaeus]